MKKIYALFLMPLIASLALASLNAWAEQPTNQVAENNNAENKSYRASKKVPAMRNRVYAQLARAQKLADEGDKLAGFEVLSEVKERLDSLNSYERAMLFNFYGFMYYGNDDIAMAVESFEKVINEEAIPDSLIVSTLYSLAQLSMQTQDYTKALQYLDQWRSVNTKELTGNQEMLFAQLYYQDKKYQQSLVHIDKAMAIAKQNNKAPKENWLTLQRASYYELNQPKKVTEVMEQLVRLYDKPQYWLQLSSMYGEIGEEEKQMAVMEAAYQAGYVVKSTDIITLSQLYLYHGAPYKSANVLEKAIEQGVVFADENNLSMLSQAYLAAKENQRAIDMLIKLSEINSSGKHDALLAQTYLNTEQWQLAINASSLALTRIADSALTTDSIEKDKATMYLIQGMANFNLKKFDASLSAFNNAAKFSSTEKTAVQWSKYVTRERVNHETKLAMLN
ncbi:tetratricopeptide repeat protein [Colwelliaceae bacterium MEBiC 14330]